MAAAELHRQKAGRRTGIWFTTNILRMNSDESGIKESYFHLADEKAGNKLLYKIISSLTPEKGAPSFGSDLISADNLFRFQSEVIRKLAAKNPASSSEGAPTMSLGRNGGTAPRLFVCRHRSEGGKNQGKGSLR